MESCTNCQVSIGWILITHLILCKMLKIDPAMFEMQTFQKTEKLLTHVFMSTVVIKLLNDVGCYHLFSSILIFCSSYQTLGELCVRGIKIVMI